MDLWPTRGRESQGGTWFTNSGEASPLEPCTRSTWKALVLYRSMLFTRAAGAGHHHDGSMGVAQRCPHDATEEDFAHRRTAARTHDIPAAFRSRAHAISGSAMARA